MELIYISWSNTLNVLLLLVEFGFLYFYWFKCFRLKDFFPSENKLNLSTNTTEAGATKGSNLSCCDGHETILNSIWVLWSGLDETETLVYAESDLYEPRVDTPLLSSMLLACFSAQMWASKLSHSYKIQL